jgi:NAD(P)-dependent dehydrogenase (short-subunit alcohol dehydrogenase family)
VKLKGKVALITGAGSGFGRAGSLLFAQEGAKVVVVDINDEGGRETVRLIKNEGGEAFYIHTDVGIVAELERMIKTAVDTYGKLNIFWHNAGNAGPGRIERTSEADFDRTLAIHVKGGFFGSKFAIPEIKKSGGGSILFTTSGSAYKPSPGSPTYSIAKAGLSILSRCLAVQLGRDNIRVNCLAPASNKTGLSAAFMSRDPDLIDPKVMEKKLLENTPMGRHGEVEEAARAALYLVSDDASFVTGAVLPVDGGMLAT